MRPVFEKVTVPEGSSISLLNRRLDEGIPFQWHYHPEFELTLTLNSRGQRYIGDSIANYDDGDLVLIGPNLPHTWCSAASVRPAGPHVAVVTWFTPQWAASLTESLPELRPVEAMLVGASRGIVFSRDVAESVRPALEKMPDLKPVERLFRLMEVLSRLSEDGDFEFLASVGFDRRGPTAADRGRIDRVLDHIHEHYRAPVSIGKLAEIACLSPSGFHRLFRRHTRLTVGEYLTQLRIGQACALLLNTRRPIAHIADATGYANLSNFNRQFRALKGMTPRQFRGTFSSANGAQAVKQ
jgi:AraC-like DNA-binding protein